MIIYDCEIKKGIAPKGQKQPGVEYCDGWRDFDRMGISVVGVYDYEEGRYRVFMDDNFDELQDLLNASRVIVGFNNWKFDDKLLGATGLNIDKTKSYDLLAEIWRAAGLNPQEFHPGTHGGYSLGDCCLTNFGVGKKGHGAQAPVLYQMGRLGELIDYCLHDIFLTKMLLDKVILTGSLISPRSWVGVDYLSVKKPPFCDGLEPSWGPV